MWSNLNTKLKDFHAISLTELNSQASFLDRIDTKYLITEKQLENILEELDKNFFVLEIDGKSVFSYNSIYMDTKNYDFYKQHQNKEKSRTKIRTRLYEDSNIAFFEYKQKENWLTRKFRYQFPVEEHWKMTKWKKRFFEWVYMSFYWHLPEEITPSLETSYKRLTLCSRDSSERLTIDFDIKLKWLRKNDSWEINLENLVIVESKSNKVDWLSSEIMRKKWIKKSSSCSKYCLWLIYNKIKPFPWIFDKTIDKIEKIRKDD